MDEMHDLNDMYMFAKVIDHGRYSAASRALGIATSKLSRRVSVAEVPHVPRLATDDLATLRIAALEGIGIALLPDLVVRKDLADGSLVAVLPDLEVVPGIVHAVFATRRGLIPAVRALIDALALGFQELETGGR